MSRAISSATSRAVSYPPQARLELCARLAESWCDLADYLGIRPHEQNRFSPGSQARAIWNWLADRGRLGDLPAALAAIGRDDLAALLADENSLRPPDELRDDSALRAEIVDFSTLIAERTEDFVGRRGLLTRLAAAIDDPQFTSGYVIVGGEPGIGKTALLATLVRRDHLVHHFNSVLTGITSTDKFLRSVCARLITQYDLPYDRLPDDVASDGSRLLSLLGESAKAQRVVVAVDAIDEAGGNGRGNQLFLPPALPRDVFFILTMRDPSGTDLYVDERRDLTLDERDPESRSDAREYIEAFIARHPVMMAHRLDALGMSAAEFAAMLAERSEGNFMYLRHVLQSVRDRTVGGTDLDALTTLPRGLQAYYAHLEQQLALLCEASPSRQLTVLAVLATWPEPLPVARLALFAGERIDTTRAVLRRWAGFLNRTLVDGEVRFALYHTSFREFLADRLDMGDVRTKIETAIEGSMR